MIEGGDLDCSTLDEVPMSGRTDGILEEWHFDENLLTEEESCSFLLVYGKNFSYYDIELFEELFYKDFAGMDWGSIPHLDLGEEPFCEEEELIINKFCGGFFPRGGALGSSTTSKKRLHE